MAKILKAVALIGIIAFSMTAAAIVGGILGIVIAPAHNNQAFAQQMGNQTTMTANPDFDARLTGTSEVSPVQTIASGLTDLDVEV
jgi:hypothetical protein